MLLAREPPIVTERIGRYEVVGELAVGGMAMILLGRLVGPRGFERPVVIKRILPHLAKAKEFVDMFVDEARIVAGIHHPNVVAVHELGREGDELFLVMEYLEGENVRSFVRRLVARHEELDRTLAMHIVAEACAGLHAAHELTDEQGRRRGLVHRDVSPHNVIVTYSGEVKVLDFGIAKAADRMTKTEAGQLKGKFEYMSPEQCAGKPLDRRSDVFALGILLYELSTGRRLFKRESELATLKAIGEQPVTPPSAVVADYPPALEAICKRALARRPADRYPSAMEMRRDLLGALRDLGGEVLPEEGLGKLMRRVFGDRIEEKREMLRRVRAGSKLTHLPAAETDGAVEIPVVEEGSVRISTIGAELGEPSSARDPPSTSDVIATEPSKRGSRRLLPLAIGAAVVVALVSLWVQRRAPVPVEGPLATTAAPEPAAAPATLPEPAPAAVILHVETTPSGARLVIDGQDRGTTPADVSIARGREPVRLEILRQGFAPLTQSVVPDVDQRLVLGLSPLGRVRPKGSSAAPRSTSSPANDEYHRFE